MSVPQTTRPSPRTAFLVSALNIAVVLAVVLGLHHAGIRTRRYAAADTPTLRVDVVGTPSEAYRLWKDLRLHGRIIFHFGRQFYFKDLDAESLPFDPLRSPLFPGPLTQSMEQLLRDDNALRLASGTNIARQVVNIVPEDLFMEKMALFAGKQAAASAPNVSQEAITVQEKGFIRTMRAVPPALTERSVVLLDASYFSDSGDLLRIQRLLRDIPVDVVTICLSEGQENVTQASRDLAIKARDLFMGDR